MQARKMYKLGTQQPQQIWIDPNPQPQIASDQPKSNLCYKLCIVLLVAVIALILAILLPFLVESKFTTNLKSGGATKENCLIATFKADVSLDTEYIPALDDPTSEEFLTLARDYCESLKENLAELYECGDQVDPCRVDQFKRGSILVNTIIKHTKVGKAGDVSSDDKEKQAKKIQSVIAASVSKGANGNNDKNLFKKIPTTVIKVETTAVEEYVQCEPVKTPRNSRLLLQSPLLNYVNDEVTVQCDKGRYFEDGTNVTTIKCLESGQWDSELTDCEHKPCPELKASVLENGDVTLGDPANSNYKDSVQIHCHQGFTFDLSDASDDDRVTICEDGGLWEPEMTTGCLDFDECASTPCQNGGTCTDQTNGYSCSCAAGYTGNDCETDIDDCASTPCQNGGTCTDQVNGYTCLCIAGFTDADCETDIDECASTPCQNGGTCTDQTNGYSCSCVAGFTDAHCETDVDDCLSTPCINGGSCNNGVNEYTCTCVSGSGGTDCEQDTVDECSGVTCPEGEICEDDLFGYNCVDVDDCLSTPCVNGGSCNNGVNEYTCTCVPGSGGTDCEQDTVDDCSGATCAEGEVCEDDFFGYNCVDDVVDPESPGPESPDPESGLP